MRPCADRVLTSKAIIRMRSGAKRIRKNCTGRRKSFPMTETSLTQTIQTTALVALYESARAPHESVAYRGALTPQGLDAPETEIEALGSRSRIARPGLDAAGSGARGRPLSLAERNGHELGERPVAEHRGVEPGAKRAGADTGRPDGVAGRRGAFAAAQEFCWPWYRKGRSTYGNAFCRGVRAGTGDCGRSI